MAGFPPFTNTSADLTPFLVDSSLSISRASLIINQSYAASVAVTGTGSTDLLPPTNYSAVQSYTLSNILPVSKYLTVNNGWIVVQNLDTNKKYYMSIQGYMDVSHSVNNSTVGVVFSITRDGITTYTQRTVHAKMPNSGDIGHISGGGDIGNGVTDEWIQNGDIIGVSIASDLSGTVSIKSSNVRFELKVVVE